MAKQKKLRKRRKHPEKRVIKATKMIKLKQDKGFETPKEIELNFSNVCGAECGMCSRPHGFGNKFFMEWDVFNELVDQLEDFQFPPGFVFQTSGNGEAFLNYNYLDYMLLLKQKFPDISRWTYNNFSMVNAHRAFRIVQEGLFTKIHVRIDSLEKWIFERNSNLNQENVFNNLKAFLLINKEIPVTILYNNMVDYYVKCKSVLGRRPKRDIYTDEELSRIPGDEAEAIKNYFQEHSPNVKLNIFRIGHSLWGERPNKNEDAVTPCPKWGVINNVTWICPNGDVSVCCYDDTQSAFVAGNILKEHILDIFNGNKRKEILEKIKNKQWLDYPCTSPKCCSFGTVK